MNTYQPCGIHDGGWAGKVSAMKKVIVAAVLCGVLSAVLAAGGLSNYFSDGLILGAITIIVLAAGSAAAVRKDRKRHAWH